jgi:predicted RecA/RadA family phage recombinase
VKNQVRDGDTFEFVTASTVRTAGTMESQGKIVGVHAKDTAIGGTAVLQLRGVFKGIPKLSTDVIAAGEPLFWDSGNSRLTKVVGTNVFAGWADVAAGNGVTTITIRLSGGQSTLVAS